MLQPKSRFDAPGSVAVKVNWVLVKVPSIQPVVGFVGSSVKVMLMSFAVGV